MSDIIDQYSQELTEQLAIDELNLKDYELKLPGRKHLWIGRLMRHKQQLNTHRRNKKKLIEKLTKSIQESSNVRLSVPAAEKVAWNTDPVKKLNEEIEHEEIIIEYLEKVEKIWQGVSFDIKNIIEIQKLETM